MTEKFTCDIPTFMHSFRIWPGFFPLLFKNQNKVIKRNYNLTTYIVYVAFKIRTLFWGPPPPIRILLDTFVFTVSVILRKALALSWLLPVINRVLNYVFKNFMILKDKTDYLCPSNLYCSSLKKQPWRSPFPFCVV